MAIGYTKKTWANGAPPALSAANLQALDDAVEAACDGVDALPAAASIWYSSSGTGGSDGNGGQPPAPKPKASAIAIGAFFDFIVPANSTIYYSGQDNAEGTWLLFATYVNSSTGVVINTTAGIGSGPKGSTSGSQYLRGWVWRIA